MIDKEAYDLTITHTFDAPRDTVWELWTKVGHMSKWWCPDGFSIPACEADVKVGGHIRLDMKGPDGKVYPMTGEYTEVMMPERLAFITTPLDDQGNPLFEIQNTAEFSKEGDRTILRLELRVLSASDAAAPYLGGMEMGWKQSLAKQDTLIKENK